MSETYIQFFGAAGEVTGSATLVDSGHSRILVDFGAFQGGRDSDAKNTVPDGLEPPSIHAVVLTHGHLDHCGRLPRLVKEGYTGPIYCTQATGEVVRLILEDSVRIREQDLERTNRRRMRAGEALLEPEFTRADVAQTLRQLHAVPYDTHIQLTPQIQACWAEAGHMIGSASILLTINAADDSVQRILFSGDLGPAGAPMLKDPEQFRAADVVVMESTYGDHDHKPMAATVEEFESIVIRAVEAKSRILIPSFAIGRSQLLMYLLGIMFRRGKVPKFPLFLDSPMAIRATEIYKSHPELMDEEFNALDQARPIEADLETLELCMKPEQSRAINDVAGPMMVIAGAGMCTGGRILHHFRHSLWRHETAVLFVGYQGRGTLGRLLVDGADTVKIFGEPVAVRADIHTLGGFSAHAGRKDLLRWLGELAPGPEQPRILLNHGEADARQAMAVAIREKWGAEPTLPEFGERFYV